MPRAPGPSLLRQVRLPLLTSRLLLRPLRRSDVPMLVPLVGDWRVARGTRIPHPYAPKDGYEFIRATRIARRKGTGLALAILERKGGRLIGGIGIMSIDWTDRHFELGYWIAPDEWGKGLATEAAHAVCQVGFRTLRMRRIEARVYAFNPRSAGVLRKIGFRLEGRNRKRHRDGKRWSDDLSFGLLTGELRAPGGRFQIF